MRPPKTSPHHIIETAYAIVREGGYGAFSRRRVAQVLNVTPATITYQMGSTEALRRSLFFHALFQEDFNVVGQAMALKLPEANGLTDEQRVLAAEALAQRK